MLTRRVIAPGQLLARRYLLREPIGAGGMAVVWRARDERLRRDVAVKFLRPQFADDEAFVERFEAEARHAASLSHPNVATVFDTGEDADERFIVMELVDGPSLPEVLARGPLAPEDAVRIASAAARALAAAHRRGLVHRDVKPGNILLGRDGRVRLGDFGIARALADSRMTATGTVLGSVPYLSPEQVVGGEGSPAGDLFSLGVVLYEMLTGQRPWTSDGAAQLAGARLHADPAPPSALVPDLPPGLEAIVMRALERDPAARYPSARAFGDALGAWERRWHTIRGRRARRAAGAAVGVAGVGALEPGWSAEPAGIDPTVDGADAMPAHAAVGAARLNPGAEVAPLEAPDITATTAFGPVAQSAEDEVLAGTASDAVRPVEVRERRRHRRAVLVVGIALIAGTVALATLFGSQQPGGVLAETFAPESPAVGALPTPLVVARSPSASPVSTASPSARATAAITPTATAAPPFTPRPTLPPTPRATPAPTPRPITPPAARASPADAVATFYRAVAAHDWDTAIALWSPGMQSRYPIDEYLIGRFSRTTRIDSLRLDTIVLNAGAGTATVAVEIMEYRTVEPSPRRFIGDWDLIRIDGRWILDDPDF